MIKQMRLWDGFRNGMPPAGVPLRWFATATAFLNGMSFEDGTVELTPDGIRLRYHGPTSFDADDSGVYAFRARRNAERDGVTMEPGDVWLGPMTVIHWADISGYDTTPDVSSGAPCVWLEVDVATTAAVMVVGTRAGMEDALDETEQLTKCVVPLVETVWADGVISKVRNLQCGDVKIFRAAG